MKRDSAFCLACFLGLVFLLLASLFEANAAPAKSKAEVADKRLSFDTGKKDKKGKAIRREFPTMFDIAARSKKRRAEKKGKVK